MAQALPEGLREDLMFHLPERDVPPCNQKVFLHGDPVPGNILSEDDGLRLIDWQCPAQGDPVHDLAIHLSPGMNVLYGAAPPCGAYRKAFLQGYGDPKVADRLQALTPFYHAWLAAYCAIRVAQGEVDYRAAMELELSALRKN